ncbi:peptidase M48 Ste24p [Segniliparus rotundus DSM 44985]|uniref:Peptidase M48 Ste24p n=2 Tax=Segniliparus rotundus TaxID=286802 RepID=D6Z8S9_SEGRD|nr:M48 family metallopeptidase [Segniliparus rotundus]ADG98359.1 peptidase M48 Ste24p [Segniliparus rotundus DSM 44985]
MTDFSHSGGSGHHPRFAQPQTYQHPDAMRPAHQQRFTIPRHPGEIPLLVITILFVLFVFVLVLVLAVFAYLGVQDKAAVDHGMIVIAHPRLTERLGAVAPFFFIMLTPLLVLFGRGVLWGIRRSQAVEITPTQFPQAYQMVVHAAQHYGLKKIPEAYVMSGNGSINANASGHGFRRFITVYSDLFEVGGEARDPDALAFVIGHECGHIAAGHTSYWRMLVFQIAQYFPPLQMALSRAQEYTADNHGYSVYPQGAMGTMRLLSGGKYLNHQVDVDAYADRAARDRGFFVWFVNFLASHPIGTWRAWALRDRSKAGKLFFAPKFVPGVVAPRSPQPATPPPGAIPSVPFGRVAASVATSHESTAQPRHGDVRPEPTGQWAPPHGQGPTPPA